MNKIFLYLRNFDWILFSAVFLLACFGLMEIYSVAMGKEGADLLNFRKQIFFVVVGTVAIFFFAFIDFRSLRNSSKYLYLLAVIVLISVLIFGASYRGTKGWFDLGIFNVQPVEFVKIILIVFLAKFFSGRATKTRPLKQLLFSGLSAFLLCFLVFLQPDFGSVLLLFFIWIVMLAITGFSRKYFLAIGISAMVISIFLWSFHFEDYQKDRILTFLNPTANLEKEGYNVNQATIAIGAGGLTGRGLGFGSQSQLKFLPEAQNDFIFAVISEELGFLGSSLVLFLYSLFFFRALTNLRKMNNDFAFFFTLGALGLIFIEMFINISMNIGILPVVGISLPFISYGGSAMVSSFIIVGIMENMIIRSKINY